MTTSLIWLVCKYNNLVFIRERLSINDNLIDLVSTLRKAKNASLVLGAGISISMGIPAGYDIPLLFCKNQSLLTEELGLTKALQVANQSDSNSDKKHFVNQFVQAFKSNTNLQRSFLDWLYESEDTEIKAMAGMASDIHAAFVVAWLKNVFSHLVTTNWDFLLEYHVDQLYNPPDNLELTPFDPVTQNFRDGRKVVVDPDYLYYLNPIGWDEDVQEVFSESRWNIIANSSDLKNLHDWTRPIWKVHGSPFFLICPQCGGFTRWKRVHRLSVGDSCPDHPDEKLLPEINIWEEELDVAVKPVWKQLKSRLEDSDMIVVCGLSGADEYIRITIESHSNAWVVTPESGDWDISKVSYVPGFAADLANLLIGLAAGKQ